MKMAKLIKQIMTAMVFSLMTTLAFAAYTPKDVISAINGGDYVRAETMIKEVTAAQPDSAQAWFYRAQIEQELARQGKIAPEVALNSLNRARTASKTMPDGNAKYNLLEGRINSLKYSGIESDVKTAIMKSDWNQAERLLKQWTANQTNNAKAWYFRAQVEERLGNVNQALNSLQQAIQLDPASSFTQDKNSVYNLKNRLQQKSLAYSNSQNTKASDIQTTRNTTSVNTVTPSKPVDTASMGKFFGYILGLIVLIGIFMFSYSKYKASQQRKNRLKEEDQQRIKTMTDIDSAFTELNSMQRELSYENKENSLIYSAIVLLKEKLSEIGIHFKTGSETWKDNLSTANGYLVEFQDIKDQFNSKTPYDPDRIEKKQAAEKQEQERIREQERKDRKQREERENAERRAYNEEQARIRAAQPTRDNVTERHHYHHNNGGGMGDFAAGAILGSMLGNHSQGNHTTIINNEVERSPASGNNGFDLGDNNYQPSQSFDLGSNDNSSGFDFGSGNSDSFDPGSDDNNW